MRTDLNEALKLVETHTESLKAEYIRIDRAFGMTLAEDVQALKDYPPFSRSPYDGYAFRAEDKAFGEKFCVIGESFAGTPFEGTVGKSQAVKIMTGGVIPDGADCVIPWEKSDRGENVVSIFAAPKPFENYIMQGEDFKQGAVLLEKGIKIGASEAALAVSGGNEKVKVFPKLRAAVISTGDEITEIGKELKKGKIYDTNMIYVHFRLKELGVDTAYMKSVPDDKELLKETFLEACEKSDIVFTTGGVSAGEKDFVPEILEKIGVDIIFKSINIKPGMPTVFSVGRNNVPIVSLSGNPFAAAVGFELIGRAALSKRSGDNNFLPKRDEAVLKNGYNKSGNAERYVKAYKCGDYVTIKDSQGNGSLKSMTESNCLVRIPAGTRSLNEGEKVEVLYV